MKRLLASLMASVMLLALTLVGAGASAAEAAEQYRIPVPKPSPRIVANRVEATVLTTQVRLPRGLRAAIDVELMEQMNVDGKTVWRTLVGRPGYGYRHISNGGQAFIPVNQVVGDGVMARARAVVVDSRGRRVSTSRSWLNGNIVGIKRPPPVVTPRTVPAGCKHTIVPYKGTGKGKAVGHVIMDCYGNRSVRPDAVTITTEKKLWLEGWQKYTESTRTVPYTRAAQLTGMPWSPHALVVEVTTDAMHIGNLPMRLRAQFDYEQLPHPPLVRAILRFRGHADSHVRGHYFDDLV